MVMGPRAGRLSESQKDIFPSLSIVTNRCSSTLIIAGGSPEARATSRIAGWGDGTGSAVTEVSVPLPITAFEKRWVPSAENVTFPAASEWILTAAVVAVPSGTDQSAMLPSSRPVARIVSAGLKFRLRTGLGR